MLFFVENGTTVVMQCFAKYRSREKTIFTKIYFFPEEIYQILEPRHTFEKMLPKGWHINLRTIEIEQRVGKRLDERLTKQLAEWQDNILHTIREIQTIATKPPEGEISCVEEKDRLVEASTPFTDSVSGHVSEGVTQLVRKQKFVGSSIEVVMYELQRVLTGEEMHKPLSKVLERLNSLEKEYSGIVQELIAILPSEVSVTDEVSKWAAFQQQILGITMLAEQQISIQSEIEDSKKQLSTTSHANLVSSHLRLPKFTLSEFTGNIIQWVSWWDRYKICIHENETLTDRDRFNYLRMYVKGAAKRESNTSKYLEIITLKLSRRLKEDMAGSVL